jgi:hypothetical protein
MRDNIIKKLLIIIIVFFSTTVLKLPTNAQGCSWEKNNACPQEKPVISDVNKCLNKQAIGLCCCEDSSEIKINKKYIVIGSIVIVFGIITILSFIVKKNEENSSS